MEEKACSSELPPDSSDSQNYTVEEEKILLKFRISKGAVKRGQRGF